MEASIDTPMVIEKPKFRPLENDQCKQYISTYWNNYIQQCCSTPSHCRRPSVSSDVTEMMVKLCIEAYGYDVIWTKNQVKKLPGDIYVGNKRVEVKAFSSNAGIGLRKVQRWDVLCLVDCRSYIDKIFVIHIINLSNDSDVFQALSATKTETIADKWANDKDACISADNLIQNIDPQYIETYFHDHIDVLLNTCTF
jgi:hypothetical protein